MVRGTVTETGAVIRTYVYEVQNHGTTEWYPCTPADVRYAFTVWGEADYQSPGNLTSAIALRNRQTDQWVQDQNIVGGIANVLAENGMGIYVGRMKGDLY